LAAFCNTLILLITMQQTNKFGTKETFFFALLAAALFLSGCGQSGRRHRDGGAAAAPASAAAEASPAAAVKPSVNVYVENSGSMDGYVKGATDFENAVYSYLSDISISGIADKFNLYYINSKIIRHDADIGDFIQKLEPSSFRVRGGNRGTSDIANVLGDILGKTQENDIAILVTDGIFSPGKGRNAAEYLKNQQVGIKVKVADYLKKHSSTAIVVYQLSSRFNGFYYNNVDAKVKLNTLRPFYIWIIGNAKHVLKLRKSVPDSKIKGSGVQNIFTAAAANQAVAYAVKPSSGKFRLSKEDTKTTIEKLGKDRRTGEVKFSVNVDFSGLLLDESYLTNAANYENHSRYELDIQPNPDKTTSYTHVLSFTSGRVHKGVALVKLKAQLPGWVQTVNDDVGTTAAAGKTYGIKYQLGGVHDAFTFANSYYTAIKINVK
jgi:hypothetical protein